MKRSGPLRRRTPLRSSWRSPVPADVRRAVRARSGARCEANTPACAGMAVHLHHRRTRAQGGGHTVANLLDCCAACHRWIHDHPAESYERGWLIGRNQS